MVLSIRHGNAVNESFIVEWLNNNKNDTMFEMIQLVQFKIIIQFQKTISVVVP